MSRYTALRRRLLRSSVDRAHAPGKRTLGPAPDVTEPRSIRTEQRRNQPWIPTSGLIGRIRRSARRS
ncbi:MAG: hypothetical protein R2878_12015 [Thermoleophilia bacterium]